MLTVNGDPVAFREGTTVASLLEDLGFVFPLLVVRVNGTLVPREAYDERTLSDGDTVDVLHLMSGG